MVHVKRILSVFLVILFTGCSATDTLTLSVLEPADVELSPGIDRIGVIDRSFTENSRNPLETLDQIFSVKGPELDSLGAAAGLTALIEELSVNERIASVEILNTDRLGNPAYGAFPAPLGWDRIDELCTEYGVQAIFSLEFYDTDSNVNYSTRRVTVEGPLGIEIPALEHLAAVETTIQTGWRVYDNEAGLIRDEFVMGETVVTTGRGINPGEAVKALTGRAEAVQSVSRNMGNSYAQSLLPYWTRVRRDYFVKGNDQFELAKRRAQTGNWDGAGEIWLRQTDHSNTKIAGRAHYNMGIISEINGDLDGALEWVRTAYEEYGEKKALGYIRILQNRLARDEVLRRQQSE
jgi:hypothetical protein